MVMMMLINDDDVDYWGTNCQAAYKAVVAASNQIFNQKLWYIMVTIFFPVKDISTILKILATSIPSQLEQYLMKYGWAGSGMVMIAIPILTSKAESDRAGESGVGWDTNVKKYQLYIGQCQLKIKDS